MTIKTIPVTVKAAELSGAKIGDVVTATHKAKGDVRTGPITSVIDHGGPGGPEIQIGTPLVWLDTEAWEITREVEEITAPWTSGGGPTRLYLQPEALAENAGIRLQVPGGVIRLSYGGGLSVEPPLENEKPITAAHVRHMFGHMSEPAGEAEASELLLVADLCRIADTDPSEGVQHALDVIEERQASLRDRMVKAEAVVPVLEEIVEASENRIAALLRLDAAMDDLEKADAAMSEARELVARATDTEVETAKALNEAKAQLGGDS